MLSLICEKLSIDEKLIIDMRFSGSYVYGSRSKDGDFDLIVVIKSNKPVQYHQNENYYPKFDLVTFELNRSMYDVVIYSESEYITHIQNHYLPVLVHLFNSDNFIIKNGDLFQYLPRLDKNKLKQSLEIEYKHAHSCYKMHMSGHKRRENIKIIKKFIYCIKFFGLVDQLLKYDRITDFAIHNDIKYNALSIYEKDKKLKDSYIYLRNELEKLKLTKDNSS